MRNMKKQLKPFLFLALLAGCWSCTNPTWEEHYSSHGDVLDMTLMDALKSRSNLSEFVQMLEQTGYSEKLAQTQFYTVWAPDNSVLDPIDTYSEVEIQQIVKNHVSRHPYSTYELALDEIRVRTVGGKRIPFAKAGEVFSYGAQALLEKDVTVLNGVLHTLNGYEPYVRNIWEFLQHTPGYESMYQFINTYQRHVFMEDESQKIGVINGEMVYDSIFDDYNRMFNMYGDISSEDSSMTVIVPDNDAWKETYEQISSYFVQNPNYVKEQNITQEELDSMQKELTSRAMLQNMFFAGLHEPSDLASRDYIYNTWGERIENPGAFFEGMKDTILSNGIVYRASQLHMQPSMWCPTEIVEAMNGNLSPDSAENSTRDLFQRSYSVRDENGSQIFWYMYVSPTTTAVKPYVTFRLNNLLSTSYMIKVVFAPNPEALPAAIWGGEVDSSKILPTKLRFVLSSVNKSGKIAKRTYANNNLYTVNPYKFDTMVVTRTASADQPFTFPYHDAVDADGNGTTLQIISAVENKELDEFTRDMYIDCIIVEPVY